MREDRSSELADLHRQVCEIRDELEDLAASLAGVTHDRPGAVSARLREELRRARAHLNTIERERRELVRDGSHA